jgi:hypothetical protein
VAAEPDEPPVRRAAPLPEDVPLPEAMPGEPLREVEPSLEAKRGELLRVVEPSREVAPGAPQVVPQVGPSVHVARPFWDPEPARRRLLQLQLRRRQVEKLQSDHQAEAWCCSL